jgi:hypothetical protein
MPQMRVRRFPGQVDGTSPAPLFGIQIGTDGVAAGQVTLGPAVGHADFAGEEGPASSGLVGEATQRIRGASGGEQSERGQEYVDTLKSIIRVNKLDLADDAGFRDEPMRFLVGAPGEEAAAQPRRKIEDVRRSGELVKIIARMRLE